ncbi:MAG: HNH endonuclease signature motif containing protein [Myxococcota bacterium]
MWARDGGRCTYVALGGRRCAETAYLELDHVVPWAKGGPSTVANLRLRCRTHNQLAADRSFGRGFMDGKRGGRCRESVVAYRATVRGHRPRGHPQGWRHESRGSAPGFAPLRWRFHAYGVP